MAQNITLLGASYADVPAVELPKTGGGTATFTDVTPTTAGAADVASGKLFFDALGVLTQGTASGGGGASNVVTGTFKGTTTEAALTVDLAYTGNGYPIAVMVFPEGGFTGNSDGISSLIQRYAITLYMVVKRDQSVAPRYTMNIDYDKSDVIYQYKNSTSQATNLGYSGSASSYPYNYDPAVTTAGRNLVFNNAKKMSVFIAGTSYGFAANITYRYWVIYSE